MHEGFFIFNFSMATTMIVRLLAGKCCLTHVKDGLSAKNNGIARSRWQQLCLLSWPKPVSNFLEAVPFDVVMGLAELTVKLTVRFKT